MTSCSLKQFLVDERVHDVAGSCVAGVFVGAHVDHLYVEVGSEPLRGHVHDRRLAGAKPADETDSRCTRRIGEIRVGVSDRPLGNEPAVPARGTAAR